MFVELRFHIHHRLEMSGQQRLTMQECAASTVLAERLMFSTTMGNRCRLRAARLPHHCNIRRKAWRQHGMKGEKETPLLKTHPFLLPSSFSLFCPSIHLEERKAWRGSATSTSLSPHTKHQQQNVGSTTTTTHTTGGMGCGEEAGAQCAVARGASPCLPTHLVGEEGGVQPTRSGKGHKVTQVVLFQACLVFVFLCEKECFSE